jgi:hypothetical protein
MQGTIRSSINSYNWLMTRLNEEFDDINIQLDNAKRTSFLLTCIKPVAKFILASTVSSLVMKWALEPFNYSKDAAAYIPPIFISASLLLLKVGFDPQQPQLIELHRVLPKIALVCCVAACCFPDEVTPLPVAFTCLILPTLYVATEPINGSLYSTIEREQNNLQKDMFSKALIDAGLFLGRFMEHPASAAEFLAMLCQHRLFNKAPLPTLPAAEAVPMPLQDHTFIKGVLQFHIQELNKYPLDAIKHLIDSVCIIEKLSRKQIRMMVNKALPEYQGNVIDDLLALNDIARWQSSAFNFSSGIEYSDPAIAVNVATVAKVLLGESVQNPTRY